MISKVKSPSYQQTNQLLVAYDTVKDFLNWFKNTIVLKKRRPFAYILIFIDHGQGQCTINGNDILMTPQHLIILNSFATLAFSDIETIKGHVVYFEETFFSRTPQLQKYLWRLLSESVKQPVLYLSRPGVAYEYIQSQLLLFKQHYLAEEKQVLKYHRLHNILSNIVTLISLKMDEPAAALYVNVKQSRTRDFLELLDIHYIQQNELRFYALMMQFSTQRLNLICLETLGINARRLQEQRMLSEVKRLLLYDYKTLHEVSEMLGFKSQETLQHFFELKTNISTDAFLYYNRELLPNADTLHRA